MAQFGGLWFVALIAVIISVTQAGNFKKARCRNAYPRGTRSVGDFGSYNRQPKNLQQCKQLCASRPRCKSFVVDQPGWGKKCHLKDRLPIPGRCVAGSSWRFINYNKQPTCQWQKSSCRRPYPRGTRSVGDFGRGKNLQQCKDLCASRPRCKSFVVDQRRGGKCHLKSRLPVRLGRCVHGSTWAFINYNKQINWKKASCRYPNSMNPYPRGTRSVGDFGRHNGRPKTLQQCKDLCATRIRCKSFVVDQRRGGKCHLKDRLPQPRCVHGSSWQFINYNKGSWACN